MLRFDLQILFEVLEVDESTTTIDLPCRPGFVMQDHQNNPAIGFQKGLASYDLDKVQHSCLKMLKKSFLKTDAMMGNVIAKGGFSPVLWTLNTGRE